MKVIMNSQKLYISWPPRASESWFENFEDRVYSCNEPLETHV
jgi:hypothetical protein